LPDHEDDASVFLSEGDGVLGVSLLALVVLSGGDDALPVDLFLIARNGGDQMHEEASTGEGLVTKVFDLEVFGSLLVAPLKDILLGFVSENLEVVLTDELPDHGEEVTSLDLDFFGTATFIAAVDILTSKSVEGLADDFLAGKESLLAVSTYIKGVSYRLNVGALVGEAASCGPVNGTRLDLVTNSEKDLTILASVVKVLNQISVVELERVNPVAESAFLS